MNQNKIIAEFLQKLAEKIEPDKFKLWVENQFFQIENETLFILVKNEYSKKWLNTYYKTYFKDALFEINESENLTIKIEIDKKNRRSEVKKTKQKNETKLNKKEIKEIKNLNLEKSNLLKDYTFDNFVKGASNEMAFDAAKIIVDNPGKTYNPFYIYGETALGKTHLMNAIGHEILQKNNDLSVYFISSEGFSQEMTNSIKEKKMDEFKKKYRNFDVLLIDDIQFFLGKNKTMDEFFFTFNTLLEMDNQIVLTSDIHPNGAEMESRIKSRLVKGLAISISPPDFETRKEILFKKAELKKIKLTEEVATYMAKKIESHVRDLEGALNKVVATSQFKNEKITIDLVDRELKELFDIKKSQISIDNIQKVVSDYYKITMLDLLSKTRVQKIVRPRQIAMALAKELTNNSLPEIGRRFDGKDHTTVMNAIKKIEELKKKDKNIKEDWEILNRKLRS